MKKAKDIMTHNTVSIDQDSQLKDAAKLLANKNLSGLPVTNDKKEVVGFISERDVIAAILPENVDLGDAEIMSLGRLAGRLLKAFDHGSPLVKDHMNNHIYSVSEETSLNNILNLMFKKNLRLIPVLDRGKHLLGLIERSTISKIIQANNKGRHN